MIHLPTSNHIRKSYIVCSTGRSGSTLLCQTLKQLKFCGSPEEYFHHKAIEQLSLKEDTAKFLAYCETILEKGTTSNGVFGIKMHWWQLYDFLKLTRQLPDFSSKTDYEILGAFFPNPKFIHIWRKDMVAQAVSTVIALQTGVWVSPLEKESKQIIRMAKTDLGSEPKRIKFQPLKIYRWEQKFRDQNRRWIEFFHQNLNSNFYKVENKQLIKNFHQEINNIVEYLGLEEATVPDEIRMPTQKQSSSINKEFIKTYNRVPKIIWKAATHLQQII